ncbi:unnamed protein product [Caenorhabditis sp. 36 PRJEB53466]|nr:unnamed protein product [Caenorhabditis sp. 36 PRJEB53466]
MELTDITFELRLYGNLTTYQGKQGSLTVDECDLTLNSFVSSETLKLLLIFNSCSHQSNLTYDAVISLEKTNWTHEASIGTNFPLVTCDIPIDGPDFDVTLHIRLNCSHSSKVPYSAKNHNFLHQIGQQASEVITRVTQKMSKNEQVLTDNSVQEQLADAIRSRRSLVGFETAFQYSDPNGDLVFRPSHPLHVNIIGCRQIVTIVICNNSTVQYKFELKTRGFPIVQQGKNDKVIEGQAIAAIDVEFPLHIDEQSKSVFIMINYKATIPDKTKPNGRTYLAISYS